MPVIARNKEIGLVHLERRRDPFEVVVRGAVGSQLMIDALRSLHQLEELKEVDLSYVEEVIKRLKFGWKRLDRYLTDGGMISQKGNGVMFNGFVTSQHPEAIGQQGFARITVANYCREMGIASLEPFNPEEVLYIAAPTLGSKLSSFTLRRETMSRSNARIYLTFRDEPKGFVDGAVVGFGELLTRRFDRVPAVPHIVSSQAAIIQRMYDHAQTQVPVLEEM